MPQAFAEFFSGSFSLREFLQANQFAYYQSLLFRAAPPHYLLLPSERFLIRRKFLRIDQGDWGINLGGATGSASEVTFDSLFKRMGRSTTESCGLEAEDVEPSGHEVLRMRRSLDSPSARYARSGSLGTPRLVPRVAGSPERVPSYKTARPILKRTGRVEGLRE